MRLFYIITLIAGLFSTSTTEASATCHNLDSLDWLLGNWRAVQDKAIVSESWMRVSDHTFEGSGITQYTGVVKPELVETLLLVEMSGAVYFLAKIDSNPRPVAFKTTHCPTGRAVFENADHDFPQRLDYQLQRDGTLLVTVTDMQAAGFTILYVQQPTTDKP
ncbi:DUF6265 family protein [Paremcibacter congregatus]|uniref:DUF6265 family protein n=1 Tax=Paremcibacter congregatus TaxID=2043170 RepID=UPI0030ED6FEB